MLFEFGFFIVRLAFLSSKAFGALALLSVFG
jgi:hypothetical protein